MMYDHAAQHFGGNRSNPFRQLIDSRGGIVQNPAYSVTDPKLRVIYSSQSSTAPSGNLIINNVAPGLLIDSGSGTVSNNVETTAYTTHFVDYSSFDFHLKLTSSLIDAGTSSDAPSVDFEGDTRDSNPDIGADEY